MRKISKLRTGMQIRNYMAARQISAVQMQEQLELESVQTIYKWLHGINMPSVQHLYDISQILEIPMEKILRFEPEKKEE